MVIASLEKQQHSMNQNIEQLNRIAKEHEAIVRQVALFDNEKKQLENYVVQLKGEKTAVSS